MLWITGGPGCSGLSSLPPGCSGLSSPFYTKLVPLVPLSMLSLLEVYPHLYSTHIRGRGLLTLYSSTNQQALAFLMQNYWKLISLVIHFQQYTHINFFERDTYLGIQLQTTTWNWIGVIGLLIGSGYSLIYFSRQLKRTAMETVSVRFD